MTEKNVKKNSPVLYQLIIHSFYLAEHVDGLTIGDIVSEDEIVVYYLEPGEAAKVIVTELDRVK